MVFAIHRNRFCLDDVRLVFQSCCWPATRTCSENDCAIQILLHSILILALMFLPIRFASIRTSLGSSGDVAFSDI
jgi:hypothetical protein